MVKLWGNLAITNDCWNCYQVWYILYYTIRTVCLINLLLATPRMYIYYAKKDPEKKKVQYIYINIYRILYYSYGYLETKSKFPNALHGYYIWYETWSWEDTEGYEVRNRFITTNKWFKWYGAGYGLQARMHTCLII